MRRITVGLLALPSLLLTAPLRAQEPAPVAPANRAEVITDERAAKVAELWPERQSPMVDRVNGWLERGLREGFDTGRGVNGFQLVLGGMRSGQGFTAGLGFRRSDLWRERLGYRATVRGTPQLAYLADFDLDFQGLKTERTSMRWYTKYEHSPHIDYYGFGNESAEENRTSYLYDDFTTDFSAQYRPVRVIHLGLTGGYLHPHTANGEEGSTPIGDVSSPVPVPPGFEQDTDYTRLGVFAFLDTRDSQTGPRSGGMYGGRYREYWDVSRKAYAFRQSELELQQYFPYFNGSRVVALRVSAVLSFPKEGDRVPFYLQPTLGGNDDLRGFERYRYRDSNSLFMSVEHRWHVSSMLDMALFTDAGKVAPKKGDLDLTSLRFDAGIGFRVRFASAVVTRIDFAGSREGFRVMWTFSDIYPARW